MEKLLEAARRLGQARQALLDAGHDATATETLIIHQAIEGTVKQSQIIESLINAMEADKC